MEIVLIILPMPFLLAQKRNAPLGILYLAAALEKAGYRVTLVDLRDIDKSGWLERIPQADIYGIGATSLEYNIAVELARKIKQHREGIIVLGGIHPTVVNTSSLDGIFDVIVQGEGELAMLELLSDYQKGGIKRCYKSLPIPNLDSLPLPARHLLPYDSIVSTSLVERGQPGTTIITSRGCPYDCTFCCTNKVWGGKVRFHSADRVVDEIKFLMKEYSIYQFRFQDDMMTINKPRLKELSQKLRSLDIKWRCHGRVDHADIETLTLLKNAGCFEVAYGIETASQEALDLCNKRTTVEQSIRAIQNTKRAGLKVRLFLIIGLPGDFGDVSGRNIAFIKMTEPDAVDISTLSPYPGCELYSNPAKFGMRLTSNDLDEYRMSLGWGNDEQERDFVFEYPSFTTNQELKYHRRELLKFVKENSLDLNR